MKVKELIEKLKEFDLDTDVLCYTEDENTLAPGHGFRLFDIQAIDKTKGSRRRAEDDNIPSIKFGAKENVEPFVFIHMSCDF